MECRSPTGLGFNPDPAAISLDNSLTDGETHTGAQVPPLAVVKPLEQAEHFLVILGIDANAVVLDREVALSGFGNYGDVYAQWLIRLSIAERIADEVLQDLLQVNCLD